MAQIPPIAMLSRLEAPLAAAAQIAQQTVTTIALSSQNLQSIPSILMHHNNT
jgi:hypothetical protein